jgi:hypothetical protein
MAQTGHVRRLALGLAALLGVAGAVAYGQQNLSRESRLREGKHTFDEALAALEKPVALDVRDAPLGDVLLAVKKATAGPGDKGVPVLVNRVALQVVGATLETPVTIASRGEPAGKMLLRLLRPLGLTYTVNNGILVVTYDAAQGRDSGRGPNPKDRPVLLRLEEPLPLNFQNAPLGDVLKFIKAASAGPDDGGIPIFIDPAALRRARMTMTTPVTVASRDGEPLKDALGRLLGAHNLAYQVKDGLLQIVSSRLQRLDRGPQTKAVLANLEQRVDLKFEKAPLEDVLKFIKQATARPGDSGLRIYVDPVGLQEAETTMQSPVSVDVKGEPLKVALRKVLKPLHLTYTVKDGLLTVTSEWSEDAPLDDPGGARK